MAYLLHLQGFPMLLLLLNSTKTHDLHHSYIWKTQNHIPYECGCGADRALGIGTVVLRRPQEQLFLRCMLYKECERVCGAETDLPTVLPFIPTVLSLRKCNRFGTIATISLRQHMPSRLHRTGKKAIRFSPSYRQPTVRGYLE